MKYFKRTFLICFAHFALTIVLMIYNSGWLLNNAISEQSPSGFDLLMNSIGQVFAMPIKFIALELIEPRSIQIFPLLLVNSLIWAIVFSPIIFIRSKYART